MVSIGDIIMHRRDVCRVKGVAEKYRDDEDYYVLAPLDDDTLTVYVLKANADKVLRPVMSRAQAEELIARIPDIEPVDIGERMIESVYKELIGSEAHDDLVRIIKTAYVRSEEKLSKGQRRTEKDKMYFRMAEKILYSELAASLDKTYEETEEFIVDHLKVIAA